MTILVADDKQHPIYTCKQVRDLDRTAIEEYQIPGLDLMKRAGRAAFELSVALFPNARSLSVLVGSGNNGGDGYIVAGLAQQAGHEVQVIVVGNLNNQSADAQVARKQYLQQGGLECTLQDTLPSTDLIIDALLGTGLQKKVAGQYADAIGLINSARTPILALDIPSGLNADTGIAMGCAVNAQVTITFVGIKTGLLTGSAALHVGSLYYDALNIPHKVFEHFAPLAATTNKTMLKTHLPARPLNSYKTQFGHALLIGGAPGMPNAIRLAAEATARTGAGLVSVATHVNSALPVSCGCASTMVHEINQANELTTLLDKCSVIGIGPGLGQSRWSRDLFAHALETTLPMVVDADALNMLAQDPFYRDDWILTPHPGEAARLLGCTTQDILHDRLACAQAIVNRYGGVVVLKGAGTIIASNTCTYINAHANPALATGGSGDVLTGIITGLLAQKLTSIDAASCGVLIHSLAADLASRDGVRGMLASDLLVALRQWVNP